MVWAKDILDIWIFVGGGRDLKLLALCYLVVSALWLLNPRKAGNEDA